MTVDARPWTAAALIGALWGALELSLGTALHLSHLPIRGLLMAGLGLLCLVSLRRLRPRFGVCILAGLVAAFLKIFTLGGFYIGPLLGILVEAVVLELSFLIFGNRRISAILGGALVVGLTPVQMVLTVWILAGREVVNAGLSLLLKGLALIGVHDPSRFTALLVVILLHSAFGAACGWWAWKLASRVQERLG